VECLKQGAEIVITGRVTDTGLTLAPMIYEFGWDMKNWDLMAAGTAIYIIECGGWWQAEEIFSRLEKYSRSCQNRFSNC
jgi:hypothetical protein